MALIIKNGTIYTASDSYRADILAEGEKITRIADKITAGSGDEVIDASGLEIYPGAIDAHTHLDMPYAKTSTADDFKSGTIAAACGGTTALIDFANPARGQTLGDAVKIWRKKADGKSAIDYGFHITLVEFNERVASEIPALIKEGITSIICFLAYKGALMIN
ncbi:MAG TPA: amidohydrolase family protein, partial [Candidatus Wallbacteria bacterium]|nr:amidohydrolase family protein [Candidatus Wallbacteria bacterium]